MNSITPPTNLTPQALGSIPGTQNVGKDQGNFRTFLLDALDQVNGMQQEADQAVEEMFTGGDVNTSEVLTAVQKADMSFRMMMQIRNKLVQAYQEIRDVRI